ncbi:hypothetical protein C8F04DRAFT_1257840 [Mycena alexandri]|uniref:Uncharacterized protein n=1 Tax=Mycena alexandri TaxID=1745969 RepID=A0AAD6T0P3_9AGAR|nr:hypothetical protein C8F04DRAFT_1257840 [Mycena alexandri]
MAESPLYLVLPLLNLKRISLLENASSHWSEDGGQILKWSELPPQLESALTPAFSSRGLRHVHLRGIVIDSCFQLLSLFSEAAALEELILSRVLVMEGDTPISWPESRPWRPQLRSLLVSEFGDDLLCQYLANPKFDLTHVNLLTIGSHSNGSNEVVGNLIQAKFPGLEHLRLSMDAPYQLPDSFGANLRSIDLCTQHILVSMADFFKRCEHRMRLEYITFEGEVEAGAGYQPHPLISLVNANIDSAVPKLLFLKMVQIRVYDYLNAPASEWLDRLRSSLPSLVRRNLLTVTGIPTTVGEPFDDWE